MDDLAYCPVPNNQRPTKEFSKLCHSWFYAWPMQSKAVLYRNLMLSWLAILPLNLVIATGSYNLMSEPSKLIYLSSTIGLLLPIILLVRQWLGWKYIFKRLKVDHVEYEDSGWYDGRIWEKPLINRQRELLIANNEVLPIINDLTQTIIITGAIFLLAILTYFYV